MLFLLFSTLASAEAFSRSLWGVTRPEHVRAPEDATTSYASPLEHEGEVRLGLDSDFYVHPEADKNALDVFIRPYIDAGYVTAEELATIQDAIDAGRGVHIDPEDFIPSFWLTTAKTVDDLIDEGWFN